MQRWVRLDLRQLLQGLLLVTSCSVSCSMSWAANAAGITVKDDFGHDVHLNRPARRIVSLAPHATELLFAAGAGPYVVGVSNYSNYPAAAQQITSVGKLGAVDIEKILTLKPDLIISWQSANAVSQVERLRSFGVPVFESQPADYAAIASSIERLSALSGTETEGSKAAAAFRARWQSLEQTYRGRMPVSVFYQIWSRPLMTLSGKHMASAVLRTCGGRNIFGDLPQLAPTVSIEAVIAADPEVIMTPDDAKDQPLELWSRFARMKAVLNGSMFVVNADWLNRPGPRILDATEQVCKMLDAARAARVNK